MDNEVMLEQLATIYKKQKALAESARRRQGQKPSKRASRAELEQQFHPRPFINTAPGFGMVRQTVIGFAYPPCTQSLASLRPMTIAELELETVHRGRVLVVRAFGHPVRVQAVQNAIEDDMGAVDRIGVYNSDLSLSPDETLPRGSLFAIKEPYYKVTADGGHTIRVDHPSDLVRLHPEDNLIPLALRPKVLERNVSPDQWKAKGNAAFKAKYYNHAAECYSRGIAALKKEAEGTHQLRRELYRNRAQSNLHLERWERALRDAEAGVVPSGLLTCDASMNQSNVKAFYRAGLAAYHTEDYDKAKQYFESILAIEPSNEDAIRELRRTEQRMVERDTGVYDFAAMVETAASRDKRLDNASFKANVEVQSTSNRGNGLFSTKDIKAGDLVVCEKALCVAYNTDQGGDQNVIMNLNTGVMSVGTHPARLVGVVNKCSHSPTLAKRLLELYDGGYQPRGVHVVEGDIVAVDTFQVEAALDRNGFGCPSIPTCLNTDETDQATSSTGVWLTCSFSNHDCIGNAARSFIGDMMVVRATKDIKKGDEITMRYKVHEDDITKFQENMQQSWQFKCSCVYCVAEEKTPSKSRQQRLTLVREAQALIKKNPVDAQNLPSASTVAKAEQLRSRIAALYDDKLFDDLPRLGLVDLDLWLCMAHIFGAQQKVQKAAAAVLRDLGFKIAIKKRKLVIDRTNCQLDLAGIHAAMYLASSYKRQGQSDIGEQFDRFAKGMYETVHGCMIGFEEKFGEGQ